MPRRRPLSILACLALALLAPAAALAAGSPEAGQRLAFDVCSNCHAVPGAPRGGTDSAPPFNVVARDARANPALVRSFLLGMHSPMQGLNLTRQQIDDVTAYLGTFPVQ